MNFTSRIRYKKEYGHNPQKTAKSKCRSVSRDDTYPCM